MNGEQTESKCAAGAWAWVRRNDGVLLMGVLVIAMIQYRTIQITASFERLILRLESFERSMERFAERLDAHVASLERSQERFAEQLDAHVTSLERSMERFAERLGLPPPEAPAAAAAPNAAGAAPG